MLTHISTGFFVKLIKEITEQVQYLSTTIIARLRRLKIENFCVPLGNLSRRRSWILSHQNAIICGDMNTHSPIFGARHSDRRSDKIVVDLTQTLNLVVLNTGEGIHLATNGSTSSIDISLDSMLGGKNNAVGPQQKPWQRSLHLADFQGASRKSTLEQQPQGGGKRKE